MTTPALQNSIVKDMGLASEGHLKIDWVEAHMPVLNRIRRQFEQDLPFKGLKVAICLHLEAKTAYLAKVIQAGGAEVTITHSNPLSTQDDVCAKIGGRRRYGVCEVQSGACGIQITATACA